VNDWIWGQLYRVPHSFHGSDGGTIVVVCFLNMFP
jgi:hypothetical protein